MRIRKDKQKKLHVRSRTIKIVAEVQYTIQRSNALQVPPSCFLRDFNLLKLLVFYSKRSTRTTFFLSRKQDFLNRARCVATNLKTSK